MEQEVKVTIHRGEPADPVKEPQQPQQEASIPEQLKEFGETISETLSCFRESESYEWLLKSAEKAKNYIKENPTRSILVSLGAGALFGLLIKKRP
jgi:ElaB/YqjD/DUF883 family membrane-anchored ribosome-binding protein